MNSYYKNEKIKRVVFFKKSLKSTFFKKALKKLLGNKMKKKINFASANKILNKQRITIYHKHRH